MHHLRSDKAKVSEYFPVNTVLLGLFDLCTKLFDITFEVSGYRVYMSFKNLFSKHSRYMAVKLINL